MLMERAPLDVNPSSLMAQIMNLDGVVDVHDFHVWNITLGKTAIAVHCKIALDADHEVVLQNIHDVICNSNIHHSTIQLERNLVSNHCLPHGCRLEEIPFI